MCEYVHMDTILKNAYFFCSYITIVLIYTFIPLFSCVRTSQFRQIAGVSTKNKNSSLRPFNGWEHQSHSTTRKCLRAILNGNQDDEGEKCAAPNAFLRKRKRLKILKTRFLGCGQISRIFPSRGWSSNPPP